jgi:hypothetical protein
MLNSRYNIPATLIVAATIVFTLKQMVFAIPV